MFNHITRKKSICQGKCPFQIHLGQPTHFRRRPAAHPARRGRAWLQVLSLKIVEVSRKRDLFISRDRT